MSTEKINWQQVAEENSWPFEWQVATELKQERDELRLCVSKLCAALKIAIETFDDNAPGPGTTERQALHEMRFALEGIEDYPAMLTQMHRRSLVRIDKLEMVLRYCWRKARHYQRHSSDPAFGLELIEKRVEESGVMD